MTEDTTQDSKDIPSAIPRDEFELAGVPDSFQRLWTPHRLAYIKKGQGHVTGEDNCPFCQGPKLDDDESLIIARGEHAYVLMNLYPYNAGHLLVVPYAHIADYTEASTEQLAEMNVLTQKAMTVLRQVASPDGFNLGINQGDVGGAGIAAHLHQHIVPRWSGDSNFLPVIAQTKAISQTLSQMHQSLAEAWKDEDSEQ